MPKRSRILWQRIFIYVKPVQKRPFNTPAQQASAVDQTSRAQSEESLTSAAQQLSAVLSFSIDPEDVNCESQEQDASNAFVHLDCRIYALIKVSARTIVSPGACYAT